MGTSKFLTSSNNMGKEGGTVKIRRLKTSKIALHILTSSNNMGEKIGNIKNCPAHLD